MSYLFLLITFLGACLGLTGQTWDPDKSGLGRLTRTGWAAFTLLVFGSILSATLTARADAELEHAREERERIQALAHEDIRFACRQAVSPFVEMYYGSHGVELSREEASVVDELLLPKGLEALASTNYYDPIPLDLVGRDDSSYWANLRDVTQASSFGLQRVQATYMHFLSADVILMLEEVLVSISLMDPSSFDGTEEGEGGVLYWLDNEDYLERHADLLRLIQRLWVLAE